MLVHRPRVFRTIRKKSVEFGVLARVRVAGRRAKQSRAGILPVSFGLRIGLVPGKATGWKPMLLWRSHPAPGPGALQLALALIVDAHGQSLDYGGQDFRDV